MNQDEVYQNAGTTLTVRRSALEKETTWALLPAGLQRLRAGEAAEVISYAEVTQVRLQFSPSRADLDRYLCTLHLHDGRKLHLVSTHYKGLLRFEDRAAAYAPFVRELLRRVARSNPKVSLFAGSSPAQYYGLIVVLVIVMASLAWGLDVPGRLAEGGWGGWIRIAALLALIPIMWGFLRANRPRAFAADQVPPRLLPPG